MMSRMVAFIHKSTSLPAAPKADLGGDVELVDKCGKKEEINTFLVLIA